MNLLLKLISNFKFVYNHTSENKVSHLNFAMAFILLKSILNLYTIIIGMVVFLDGMRVWAGLMI